jgi:hypothetical protein
MRRLSFGQATAAIGFAVTFVVMVSGASCGANNSGELNDDASNGGSSSGSNGGDDGSAGCTFCTGSSGGSSDAGFKGGGDAGSVGNAPPMQNSLVSLTNAPNGVASSQVTALEAASPNSGSGMKMLYPYDQTVFPGGIGAPTLQWSQSGTPDSVYIHLSSSLFDYKGFFPGASPTNVALPQTPWLTAWSQSKGKSDPLTVEVATSTGGTVASVTTHWIFAKGSLAGDVYYNTYGSQLLPGKPTTGNGAVMRIAEGATAPSVFLYTTGASPFGPCINCHSLSSNGSYIVAQQHFYPGGLQTPGSMSWDLVTNTAPSNSNYLANNAMDDWGFGAMYPDGTFLMTAAEPQNSATGPMANGAFPAAQGNNPGMIGPTTNTFYNTLDGGSTPVTGLDTQYAMMPTFSSDGTMLVYNDSTGADSGLSPGGRIGIANFNASTKTFSNAKVVYTTSTMYPGWPWFTPDNKNIIFALGTGWNYATEVPPGDLTIWNSYLYILDVASGTAHRLDEAAGFDSSGTEYLPFVGRDEDYDFYPTINPIAAGGYFWVYFTSRRTYGNVYNGAVGTSGAKAIWVTAIDIAPAAGTDPSHPAFFLPGQEVGSGNIRAFPVLKPCSGNGATCESGLDCCGGSCTVANPDAGTGMCGVPAGCAMTNDKCSSSVPCCDHSLACLGGYCSQPAPQ